MSLVPKAERSVESSLLQSVRPWEGRLRSQHIVEPDSIRNQAKMATRAGNRMVGEALVVNRRVEIEFWKKVLNFHWIGRCLAAARERRLQKSHLTNAGHSMFRALNFHDVAEVAPGKRVRPKVSHARRLLRHLDDASQSTGSADDDEFALDELHACTSNHCSVRFKKSTPIRVSWKIRRYPEQVHANAVAGSGVPDSDLVDFLVELEPFRLESKPIGLSWLHAKQLF
jgi:hypothetical protein